MRESYAKGELTGSAAELMEHLPPERLYDTKIDPETNNLAESSNPEHQKTLNRLLSYLE